MGPMGIAAVTTSILVVPSVQEDAVGASAVA